MAIESSFFNSVNGDRKYKAEDWAAYFASFVGNGYFAESAESLRVERGDGMRVVVRPGKAFVNGYRMSNTADHIMVLPTADGVLSRIDRIVVRWSLADREMTLAVKAGTPAVDPVAATLQRDSDTWELALADVRVSAGALSVTETDIVDLRMDENLCGIVTGIIKQFDTSDFVAQYNAMLDQLTDALKNVQDGSAWLLRTGGQIVGPVVFNQMQSPDAAPIVTKMVNNAVYAVRMQISENGAGVVEMLSPDDSETPVAGIEITESGVRAWPQLDNIRYVASADEIAGIADKRVGDLFVVPAE